MSVLSDRFGTGEYCVCSEIQHPVSELKCGSCQGNHVVLQRDVQGQVEASGDEEGVEGSEGETGSEEYGLWVSQCSKVEAEAKRLLEAKIWTFKACENLILQMPLKPQKRHRRMLGEQPATYLLLGMYSHGNHYGIARKSRDLPYTTRYLNECLRQWKQEDVESTSLVISINNKLPLHKDHHNLPGTLNHVVGMGNYTKGGIWIESQLPPTESAQSCKVLDNGQKLMGKTWPTRHQVVSFSGTSWHETEAWQGTRVTIAVHCSRGYKVEGLKWKGDLQGLGFHPPKIELAPGPCEHAHVVRRVTFKRGTSGQRERGVHTLSEREKEKERIRRQLYLLHAATGHGSKRVLVDALKRRNASEEVLQMAQEFRCSVCE